MRGLVYSFRAENGFGYAELEDGSEVLFDVSACLVEPAEGQAVRVVLGASQSAGRPKVVRVEPEDQPDSTRPVGTLEDAIKRLQAEGIALELGPSELSMIVGSLRLPALPSSVPAALAAYYAHPELGPNRALSDRYLFAEELVDADAALADLLAPEPTGVTRDRDAAQPRAEVEAAVDRANARLHAERRRASLSAAAGCTGCTVHGARPCSPAGRRVGVARRVGSSPSRRSARQQLTFLPFIFGLMSVHRGTVTQRTSM